VLSTLLFQASLANAAVLNNSSLSQSDPRPSQTGVTDTFLTSNVTSATIKCIKVVYSSSVSSPTAPAGFSSTGATINAASTYINGSTTGWTLDATTNGTLLYTNATGITPGGATRNLIVDGLTNGSTVGTTYFYLFNTYNNVDCATSPVDNIQLAYVYTNAQTVTFTVDPTLTFTVSGIASAQAVNSATTNVTTTSTAVPLGTPTIVTNQIAAQDLTVSTNAGVGYTVSARYTSKPTSAGNTLNDHTGTNAAPTAFSAAGTEAFGYTTNDATLGTGTANRFTTGGGNKWAAMTTSNAEVAYDGSPVSNQTTRVGFQVGISNVTKAGNYTTTVIYTATPVF
jgi:hypothetical protein